MFADPIKNLKQLGLREDMIVADLGAGTGYYSIAASSLVPKGKVYAIEVIKEYDMILDEYTIVANAVWLNPVGQGKDQKRAPMPFNHKLMPFGWTIWKAIDEKLDS